ncbi:amino acid adenylation domain-containing protein [Lacrimispora sp.]|uniref:amino acid adenylation domain-containing protein n=1 Tax=Lacrimispora sp. TaxID=2719234 RepID=UPI0028AA9C16|nr:amino acid adenylation domain-containing protein [Lacrimispora sp.]
MKASVVVSKELIPNKEVEQKEVWKAVAAQIYHQWFAKEEAFRYGSLRAFIRDVSRKYPNKDTVVMNDFACSMIEMEDGVNFEIDCDRLEGKMLTGIREFAEEILKEWKRVDWNTPLVPYLPKSQVLARKERNQGIRPVPVKCLHEGFFTYAAKNQEKTALIWYEGVQRFEMSYGELKEKSLIVAGHLKNIGAVNGSLVGISLPKGILQVIGVYGILAAGAAYVPIGIYQPEERRKKILEAGAVKWVIASREDQANDTEITGTTVFLIEEMLLGKAALTEPCLPDPGQLAYVIFTSGTTGIPKGVMISHKAAYNTIFDIQDKFHISANSRGIAISELEFDLSVFDILGLLSAGGSLVLLSEETKKEPVFWRKVIVEEHINLWNSVPALFDMLVTICEADQQHLPLTLILLSGDWIRMDLFERIKALAANSRFVSLGGATEASIWSNYYIVDHIGEEWKSIPYGLPLSNQYLRVVGADGYDCPDYVSGELWIGGNGVAQGYLNDPELTVEKFVEEGGERWYRTGDLARYNSQAIVEFLGRLDHQVKINGYRIELGEVENVIRKSADVAEAVVGIYESHCKKELGAVIVPHMETPGKVHIMSVAADDGYSDSGLKQRKSVVRSYLQQLLSKQGGWIPAFLGVAEFWKKWLQVNGAEEIDLGAEDKSAGQQLERMLSGQEPVLNEILAGRLQVEELLQIQELSPEYWSLFGEDTKYFLGQVFNSNLSSKKIAVLGARTGEVVMQYADQFGEAEIVTLFDRSAGMLGIAKERLKDMEVNVQYCSIHYDCLPEEEVNRYDMVLAVNTIHTYENPADGLDLTALLLKPEGKFYSIEYEELDPMGVLISGILENGFENGNPLLLESQWQHLYQNSLYEQVIIKKRGKLGAMLMESSIKGGDGSDIKQQILKFLNTALPQYMIPAKRVFAKNVALNKNGKIDRKQTLLFLNMNQSENVNSLEFQGIEADIAKLWEEILHCRISNRQQSFFEAGGDSLSATRFLSRVKQEFRVEIPLKEIFDKPALEMVGALIAKKQSEAEEIFEGEI